jgi:ribonuclease III
VLELAIARTLYDELPEASEGRLAKIRSHVVSRLSCAAVARDLDLGRRLVERAGDVPPDELQRIVRSRNVLAALLEAAIAAVYLEHGFEAIEDAIVAAFAGRIEEARTTTIDHKTELQEVLARSGRQVTYSVLDVDGPPHERHFLCAALVDGDELGRGTGRTKKDAEQEAAGRALESLGASPSAQPADVRSAG